MKSTPNIKSKPIFFRSPEVKLDLAILFQLFNLNVAARVLLEDYLSKIAHVNDFVQFIFGRVLLEHSLGNKLSPRYSNNEFTQFHSSLPCF